MFKQNSDRAFKWVSSKLKEHEESLISLEKKMNSFYSNYAERKDYQAMLEESEELKPDMNSVRYQMPFYVFKSQAKNLLEIGCSNGKLYRFLQKMGFKGNYTGIDLPDYLINNNKVRHPECNWVKASTYNIPFANNTFELVFSLYVLEHLIYPERALLEQLRVTKSSGKVVLVFPDFVCSGRLGSQQLGYSPGTFKTKIRKGKFIDALVSLYDSRIRLPRALKVAVSKYGSFPINTSPVCLSNIEQITADVDAIYISSKSEIINWAVRSGYKAELPCGKEGEFVEQSFIVIQKI